MVPDAPIPQISKSLVKSKLSKKFEELVLKDVQFNKDKLMTYVEKNKELEETPEVPNQASTAYVANVNEKKPTFNKVSEQILS